jgi:hypothetical protein
VHALALLLREIAYLRLRELDVLDVALAHLRDGAFDFGGRKAEILWRPFIEFFRQLADRGVLALVDLRQDAFHRLAHLGVGGLDRARVHSALEPTSHDDPPSLSYPSPERGGWLRAIASNRVGL